MNRTKLSALNAISAIVLTLVNGFFSIIVTRLVLQYYGSDFNGLNSTANQIINVLLVLEGGFTLASNVALFSPINRNDYAVANGVLKATRTKFKHIGIAFLVIGTLVAIVYSYVAKTNLTREFVFTVIIMTVFPQAVNLYFATVYRVLLQTQQKEYIISGITAATLGAGHLVNILLIINNGEMWMVRFTTMLFALINSALLVFYTKRNNKFLDFSVEPKPELIVGTNDVMAQKITGVIYTSWPIVYLSISSSGGTMLASVYAVYNNVFVMLKALLHGIIDAPRLSFGQMLTEKKADEIWPAFKEYEYVAIFFTFIAMTTASAVILPFISIYTSGVTDINYYDKLIASLMVLIGMVEMLHIPSGHMINMSGNFKVSKNFQILACILLVGSMAILGSFFGVYGMLGSLLIVAVLLAILEIGFIHTKFFNNRLREFAVMLAPYIILGFALSFVEMVLIKSENTIVSFLTFFSISLIANTLMALAIGYLFNKKELVKLISRGKSLLVKFSHMR